MSIICCRRRLNRQVRLFPGSWSWLFRQAAYSFLMPSASVLQIHRQAAVNDRSSPVDAQWNLHLTIPTGVSAIPSDHNQIIHSQAAHAPELVQLFGHAHTTVTAHTPTLDLSVIILSWMLLLATDHSPR